MMPDVLLPASYLWAGKLARKVWNACMSERTGSPTAARLPGHVLRDRPCAAHSRPGFLLGPGGLFPISRQGDPLALDGQGGGCCRESPRSSLSATAGRVASLPGLFLAGAVSADTLDLSGTTVTIRPHATALAEVVYLNAPRNGSWHNGEYPLTLDGLTVIVAFTWDASGEADSIALRVPAGVVCALHDLQSVGM
jgi:hypothetical protein